MTEWLRNAWYMDANARKDGPRRAGPRLLTNRKDEPMQFQKLMSAALIAAASATLVASPVTAQTSPAAAQPAHYSATETLVGQLLDNPATAEILKRLIPTVYANEMFQTAGRDLTLKAIQQYEPEALSDPNLAKIQVEFDKLPARK